MGAHQTVWTMEQGVYSVIRLNIFYLMDPNMARHGKWATSTWPLPDLVGDLAPSMWTFLSFSGALHVKLTEEWILICETETVLIVLLWVEGIQVFFITHLMNYSSTQLVHFRVKYNLRIKWSNINYYRSVNSLFLMN